MPLPTSLRILLVDNIPTTRKLMTNMLQRKLKFESIDQASDGDEAYQMILNNAYDLVITDWKMPNLSGVDLVKRVRTHSKLSTLPILIFSAMTDEESREIVMKSGASGFLGKPFTLEELNESLDAIFSE